MKVAFFYTTLFIGLCPLLILLYKRKATLFSHPFVPFLVLTAVATVYEYVGSIVLKINTAYWSQVYSLLEILALYYFFYQLFKATHKKTLWSFFILMLAVYLTTLINYTTVDKWLYKSINTVPITVFVLYFSFMWIKNLFQKMEVEHLHKHPDFYFVSGIAIYYASTFFYFFMIDGLIADSPSLFYNFWWVNVIATFIMRSFLIIGTCWVKEV